MTDASLRRLYGAYIDCLNLQDWDRLHLYVAEDVRHNGRQLGLDGYRAMLVDDYRAIPDLSFNVALLACEAPIIASRLAFDCTPTGLLFGIAVNGRRVQFAENVFYEIGDGRIREVWSVIDKTALAAQL